MSHIKIAPSLLAADYLHLKDDIDSVYNADYLHIDVMDGHFVPNLNFGPETVVACKRASDLPLDVHLMISNPDDAIDEYLDAGADILGFHIEATNHANRLVARIHEMGAKASVTLNPSTPVVQIEECLGDVDQVLLMSVNPGFGGQKFIESSINKVKKLKNLCNSLNVSPDIEIDGGINLNNAAEVIAAGANVLVAGGAIFHVPAAERVGIIEKLRKG